jgi:ribosome maturation factor RimP
VGTNPTLQYVYRRYILANIEEKVEKLLTDKVNGLGYELYDVQYAKEGKDYFLKVFIDKPNVIDLNDCEKVSNEINPLLDEVDYIKEQYFLEVSSPGIERILRKDKHLKDNIGKLVELRLFKPIDKQKLIEGILENFDNDFIEIKINEDTIKVERKNISVIKTIYEW